MVMECMRLLNYSHGVYEAVNYSHGVYRAYSYSYINNYSCGVLQHMKYIISLRSPHNAAILTIGACHSYTHVSGACSSLDLICYTSAPELVASLLWCTTDCSYP